MRIKADVPREMIAKGKIDTCKSVKVVNVAMLDGAGARQPYITRHRLTWET